MADAIKTVTDFFKGKKKEELTPEEIAAQASANPTNVNARIMQISDLNKKKKQMLDDMDN